MDPHFSSSKCTQTHDCLKLPFTHRKNKSIDKNKNIKLIVHLMCMMNCTPGEPSQLELPLLSPKQTLGAIIYPILRQAVAIPVSTYLFGLALEALFRFFQ